jgi:tRNA 2-thiouridine synthesizing protein A
MSHAASPEPGPERGPAVAEIDARDMLCPLPVLRLQKALRALPPGARVRLVATDPASWVDVPHFCAQGGHRLVEAAEDGPLRLYLVERGSRD